MLRNHLAVEVFRQNEEIALWIEIFLGTERKKTYHFCKGKTLSCMHDRRAFQQVRYEKLSQRTFSFLIMLPPSTCLRHSYDGEDGSNRLHDVHTHSTFEQFHSAIHLKPKVWNRTRYCHSWEHEFPNLHFH